MNIVERAKAWIDQSAEGIRTPSEADKLIRDLLAVVERIDKFSDGAIAVPGSIGYVEPGVTFDDGENGEPDGPWYAIEGCEPEALTMGVGAPHSYEDYMRASELYSTPELAMQAARRRAEDINKVDTRQAAEDARGGE